MDREKGSRTGQASRLRQAGFSVAELAVVIALVGIMFGMTVPFFVRYYQTASARANIQTMITIFNQARELAIKSNLGVCVTVPDSTHVVFRTSSCAGTVWVGAGTDSVGNINLPQGFTISPLNNVSFNYLGAASAAQTYTMTNSTTGHTQTFSVALTGRITSP